MEHHQEQEEVKDILDQPQVLDMDQDQGPMELQDLDLDLELEEVSLDNMEALDMDLAQELGNMEEM